MLFIRYVVFLYAQKEVLNCLMVGKLGFDHRHDSLVIILRPCAIDLAVGGHVLITNYDHYIACIILLN